MTTFHRISLHVSEYETLNWQRQAAASRFQTSKTRESELQAQLANVQTNVGLNPSVLNTELTGVRNETMLFQALMNDLEDMCNDKKREIRERMGQFNYLSTCVIRSLDDVIALRRFLTWVSPISARPIRYKAGKVAYAGVLLEGIERLAGQLRIEIVMGLDRVMEMMPVGGDVFIPGDI